MRGLFILCVIFNHYAWAGRPVTSSLTIDQLIEHSEIIAQGSINKTSTQIDCPQAYFTFKINSLKKGDKNLIGKTISVYPPNHLLLSNVKWKNSKGPSYQNNFYKHQVNLELKQSTIYIKKSIKNCYELVAQGAQTE